MEAVVAYLKIQYCNVLRQSEETHIRRLSNTVEIRFGYLPKCYRHIYVALF